MANIAVQRIVKDEYGNQTTAYVDATSGEILPNLSGYTVISGELVADGNTIDPKKPYAVPRVVRKEDGMNKTVWVDAKTGVEVADLGAYNLLDGSNSNVSELGLVREVTEEEQAQVEAEGGKPPENTGMLHDGAFERGNTNISGTPTERTMANNFGYVNRPGAMKLAGFLPGPLGMVGKVANVGLNIGNKEAVDAAQGVLGFTNQQSRIGQYLTDTKGYVGDLTYSGVTSPVGLESEDKLGRTTLTPNEARMRQQLAAARQATEEETKANIEKYGAETGKRGILGNLFGKKVDMTKDREFTSTKDTAAPVGTTATAERSQWGNLNREAANAYRGAADNLTNPDSMLEKTYSGPKGVNNKNPQTQGVVNAAPGQVARVSPESFAAVSPALGFAADAVADRSSRYSREDKLAMAATLAGEIDTRYSKPNTPEAVREAFGILSTMENREARYGTIQNAIFADKQYSTWNDPKAANTAKANYQANPGYYNSLVDSYLSNPENNLGFTSYLNPSIASPDWASAMQNPTQIGPHQFGYLSEYGPNEARDRISSWGQLQSYENDREDRVGFTPSTKSEVAKSNFASGLSAQRATSQVGSLQNSTEDRSTRSSVVDKASPTSSFSSSSMATGRSADRGSVSGYSSKSTASSGFAEDRSTRSSVVDKAGGSTGKSASTSSKSSGSMAAGKAADRGSVSGYSGSKSSSTSSSGKTSGYSGSRSDGWT